MGEEPWRVHRVGAPSLDHLSRHPLLDRPDLERELGVKIDDTAVVVAYHPVTLARDTVEEADELFAALDRLERQIVFCFPNADAGSRELIRRATEFCRVRAQARLFVNLHPVTYWSLLRHAALMLGNSSSGIMETPSLELPTVNIGVRQNGRERAANIIDAAADHHAILAAVRRADAPEFRRSLRGMQNPYGDGHAAERIRDVLLTTPLGQELLIKQAVPLGD
jgi:UDP-N-acetylglucosamine 2-epimerase (non-hydrolysing)/GDP/UDP-N,N'-diacetylbacillosamine 2-epimerase (hydrolysing)